MPSRFRGPFLYGGVTLAIVHLDGNVSVSIAIMNILVKEFAKIGAANFIILAEILSIPVALEVHKKRKEI